MSSQLQKVLVNSAWVMGMSLFMISLQNVDSEQDKISGPHHQGPDFNPVCNTSSPIEMRYTCVVQTSSHAVYIDMFSWTFFTNCSIISS